MSRSQDVAVPSLPEQGRFRKKPVIIEAWRIDFANKPLPEWVNEAFRTDVIDWDPAGDGLWINTLEGHMVGDNGDMLIRGVKGELYACKPDIFAATYEPADRAAGRASAEPEGFVLVPREPTEAMQYAAERAFVEWGRQCDLERDGEVPFTKNKFTHSDSYRAMLAAAPTPTASIAPKAEAVTCERCGHENWIMEGKAPCQITEADKRAAPKAEGEAEEVAAFETWAASEGWDVERKGPLNLRESSVNIMWAAWQARARGSAIRPTDPGRERQIGISDDGHEPFWRWIRNAYRDPDALGATFSYWNMQVAFKAGWRATPVAQAAAGALSDEQCATQLALMKTPPMKDGAALHDWACDVMRAGYRLARPEADADRASGGE